MSKSANPSSRRVLILKITFLFHMWKIVFQTGSVKGGFYWTEAGVAHRTLGQEARGTAGTWQGLRHVRDPSGPPFSPPDRPPPLASPSDLSLCASVTWLLALSHCMCVLSVCLPVCLALPFSVSLVCLSLSSVSPSLCLQALPFCFPCFFPLISAFPAPGEK